MSMIITTYSRITDERVALNGIPVSITHKEGAWLTRVYHSLGAAYPKFFKMDNLSKAGFLASAMVLDKEGYDGETVHPETSVILMNRSSSLDDDTRFRTTIEPDNYFPSPAVFVYTLANIVTGEVAIRYKITGETSFYITERFSPGQLVQVVQGAFADPSIRNVICGWTEFMDGRCDCMVMMVKRGPDGEGMEFNEYNINNLYIK